MKTALYSKPQKHNKILQLVKGEKERISSKLLLYYSQYGFAVQIIPTQEKIIEISSYIEGVRFRAEMR